MSRRPHGNNKRRSDWGNNGNAEEVVDDLAHAATFAMMTMMIPTAPLETLPGAAGNNETKVPMDDDSAIVEGGNDDIEIESSADGESETPRSDEESNKSGGNDGDDDDDDDDDQSDVDLAEALARMDPDETMEEEDEHPSSNKVPRPPKTEHELDAYRTPIQELEKHLQFQLSVTPEEAGTAANSAAPERRRLMASNLQLAGRIKHFMAFDRTVVVESSASNPHGDAASFVNERAPLDEGTLLVLRAVPDGTPSADEQLIPLGRIFEVFGPVSQPLYTIRLPSKPVESKKKEQSKPAAAKSTRTIQDKGTTVVSTGVVLPESSSPVKSDDKTSEHNKDSEEVETEGRPLDDAAQEEKEDTTMVQEELAVSNTTSITVEPAAATSAESLAVSSPPEETDPWAPNGKYAKLLQQKHTAVYYVRDEAKLIDTGFIMKMSRKGCGTCGQATQEMRHCNAWLTLLLFCCL
jgi:rRNA processing protein Gar1